MPELPEVETTRLAISPHLNQQTIEKIVTRTSRLRYPVLPDLQFTCGQTIVEVLRRGKYLVLKLSQGCLLIHLGMSGRLSIVSYDAVINKHDHIDLILTNGVILRYCDPRRFGLWLYSDQEMHSLKLLAHLGLEPLEAEFNGLYLHQNAFNKKKPLKSFIMDNQIVVGVGNIYATESLFLAGLNPLMPAGLVTLAQFERLALYIKKVLTQAIDAGGTTLRDFYQVNGNPGYFVQQLNVYGRKDKPCYCCQNLIKSVRIAGRSSTFCSVCQPL